MLSLRLIWYIVDKCHVSLTSGSTTKCRSTPWGLVKWRKFSSGRLVMMIWMLWLWNFPRQIFCKYANWSKPVQYWLYLSFFRWCLLKLLMCKILQLYICIKSKDSCDFIRFFDKGTILSFQLIKVRSFRFYW